MRRSGLEILERIFYDDVDGRAEEHSEDYRKAKKELDDMLLELRTRDNAFMIKLEDMISGCVLYAEHDAFIRGFMLARRLLFPVDRKEGE